MGQPAHRSGQEDWKLHDPTTAPKGLKSTYLYLYAGRGGSYERMLRTQTVRLVNQLKKLGLRKLHISLHTNLSARARTTTRSGRSQLNRDCAGMVAALKK